MVREHRDDVGCWEDKGFGHGDKMEDKGLNINEKETHLDERLMGRRVKEGVGGNHELMS